MQKELDRTLIFFGIILLGSVIWFLLALYKTTKDVNRVRNWIEVPCLIKSVEIGLENTHPKQGYNDYSWTISYEYEYEGREYTSSRYNIVEKNKAIVRDRMAEREEIIKTGRTRDFPKPYSVGDKAVCFVNPKNPIESVLVRKVETSVIIFNRLLAPGIIAVGSLIVLLIEERDRWGW